MTKTPLDEILESALEHPSDKAFLDVLEHALEQPHEVQQAIALIFRGRRCSDLVLERIQDLGIGGCNSYQVERRLALTAQSELEIDKERFLLYAALRHHLLSSRSTRAVIRDNGRKLDLGILGILVRRATGEPSTAAWLARKLRVRDGSWRPAAQAWIDNHPWLEAILKAVVPERTPGYFGRLCHHLKDDVLEARSAVILLAGIAVLALFVTQSCIASHEKAEAVPEPVLDEPATEAVPAENKTAQATPVPAVQEPPFRDKVEAAVLALAMTWRREVHCILILPSLLAPMGEEILPPAFSRTDVKSADLLRDRFSLEQAPHDTGWFCDEALRCLGLAEDKTVWLAMFDVDGQGRPCMRIMDARSRAVRACTTGIVEEAPTLLAEREWVPPDPGFFERMAENAKAHGMQPESVVYARLAVSATLDLRQRAPSLRVLWKVTGDETAEERHHILAESLQGRVLSASSEESKP